MKKQAYLILFFCLVALSSVAQQRAQSSLDHVNPFNLNHAYAGFDTCHHVFVQHKQQWTGVSGAPTNTQIQGTLSLKPNLGVGLDIVNWEAGLLHATSVSATIGKHFALGSKYRLGAAASLGWNQWAFNMSDVVVFDSDTYFNQMASSRDGAHGDVAVLLSSEQLEAGIAIPNVLSAPLNFETPQENHRFNIERYLNAHASYRFDMSSTIVLVPQVIYRSIPRHGSIVDMKATARFRDMLGFSVGFRTQSGLLAALDLRLNDRFHFGYAYDAGMARLNGISNGSHEFLLGVRLCKKAKPEPEPAPAVQYYSSGVVTDSNGKPVPGITITLTDAATGVPQTVTTGSEGRFRAPVNSNATYRVAIDHPDYESVDQSLSIVAGTPESTNNIALTNKLATAEGVVTDANTGKPLANVSVELQGDGTSKTAMTDEQGKFTMPLDGKMRGDALNYSVRLAKEGYELSTHNVSHTLSDYNPLALQTLVPGGLTLAPEKQPEQISEIIDLQPIRFEVASAKLTQDATVELDKVVEVLNKNPEM